MSSSPPALGDSLPGPPCRPHRALRQRAAALLVLLACGARVPSARADDPDRAYAEADARIGRAANDVGSIEMAVRAARRTVRTAQQRLADAELLMGVKDYERAADVLNEVVVKFENDPTAYPDALSLLGETYFLDGQHLSARRIFEQLVLRVNEPRFGKYYERSVVRLVDIALRLRDYTSLDRVFAGIGPRPTSGALAYAKGKGLYAQGQLAAAHASLSLVPADHEYAHQSRYLLGVIAVNEATPPPPTAVAGGRGDAEPAPVPKERYAQAVERFREATRLPPDTKEHRHVIDLSWLAIGRLLYESAQWTQAVAAYNRIDRGSPEFGTMLYELAWVYVRLGDMVRAQRALEVLGVAAPNSQDVADASLLRADLMLRHGEFDKSLKVYESVKGTYESLRERVDGFLRSTTDPRVYFETLSQDQLELFESGAQLPALVVRWARESDDGETAFAIIDDIALSRRLVNDSNEMIDKLNAVLASPNRVRALPGLKNGAEHGLGLLNGIALARLTLAHGLDDFDDDLSPELAQVRARRRSLEPRLGLVPVTAADFAGRESQALRQWNLASQSLQRLDLEVDTLQATVNGLRKIIKDSPQSGVVRSPQQVEQFLRALDEQERNLAHYRKQMAELRRFTEAGKVQVGFGDQRFLEDAQVRKAFTQVLWQEVKLSQAGAGGSELAGYAHRLAPLLGKADAADARIETVLAELERTVAAKAAELQETVRLETRNIVGYSLQLGNLDQEARMVVGGVAMRNFGLVRDRLRNIVLRADVGITEEAWEVREEQLTRLRRLRVDRARGERQLQEELKEVLDDSGEPEEP